MSNDMDTIEQPTVEAATSAPPQVVIERQIQVPVDDRRSRIWPFLAGVITAVAAGAIGLAVFFVVSDADDDGNIELDVPAVELEIQE